MEYLAFEKVGRIGYVTIQNEQEFNALSEKVIAEFDDLVKEIGEKREVKVVVVQGLEKIFSPGHNLREIDKGLPHEVLRLFQNCQGLMKRIREAPQVFIAKVHGAAVAAGCQLVAICDMAVASDKARFATPGINSGLFCTTPAVFLGRNIGRKKAAELLFTGSFMSAEDAMKHGLVNKVVPMEELDEETKKMAEAVESKSLNTIEIGKRAFYQLLNMEDFQALNYATEVIAMNSKHPDAVEGITAFLNKRPPVWDD